MSLVIDVRDVTWKRDNKTLLSSVNWQVKQGDHWAILGLNGSGKTTLLNLVAGYLWPTTGKISVLGHEYGTIDLRELRKSIGWVSSAMQDLLHTNDLAQNVVVSGKFASFGLFETPTAADRERALQIMHELGIGHLRNTRYTSCSQGEKQKLLIGRALMASPRILILDEPCNGLDVFSREQLLTSIEHLTEKPDPPTVIYVTHHVEEIVPAFSKVLLLRSGEVFQSGPSKEILTSESLTDFFQTRVDVEWLADRPWLKVVKQ